MTDEQERWWSALVGLVAAVILLALLTLIVLHVTIGPHRYLETPFTWSRTIMHELFGQSR